MAQYSTSDLRGGFKIEIEKEPYTVVSNEFDWSGFRPPRALGIEELRVVGDVRKQGGAAHNRILLGHAVVGERGAKLRFVSFRSRQRVLQSDGQRSGTVRPSGNLAGLLRQS